MKIVKYEKISLSQSEMDTLQNCEEILDKIRHECECSSTITLIENIMSYLDDLWEDIEGVE